MKIIREPHVKKSHQIICINGNCEAIMECETHELEYIQNSHKGSYYVMTCPCCGVETAINSHIIKGD